MRSIFLRPGDVVVIDRVEYAVDYVNDSRARCQPLGTSRKQVEATFQNRAGDSVTKTFSRAVGQRDFSISPKVDEDVVTRRLVGSELNDFLARNRPRAQEQVSGGTNEVVSTNSMSKAKSKDLPTQGRAAFIHKLRDAKTPKAEVLEKTQAKFRCPKGLFDKIWDRDSRGEAKPKVAKPAKASKKKAGKTPPAKAAKAKAGGPPPKPAAQAPAAEPVVVATPAEVPVAASTE